MSSTGSLVTQPGQELAVAQRVKKRDAAISNRRAAECHRNVRVSSVPRLDQQSERAHDDLVVGVPGLNPQAQLHRVVH
jgi:hypothetical protein